MTRLDRFVCRALNPVTGTLAALIGFLMMLVGLWLFVNIMTAGLRWGVDRLVATPVDGNPSYAPIVQQDERRILRLCPQWDSKKPKPESEVILMNLQYALDKRTREVGLPQVRLVLDCENPDVIHRFWDDENGELDHGVEVVPGRDERVRKCTAGIEM